MDYVTAMKELKRSCYLMFKLQELSTQPSMDAGLVFVGELIEHTQRSLTSVISILKQQDHNKPAVLSPCMNTPAGSSKRDQDGRRVRKYPHYYQIISTKRPYDDDGYVWKKYGQKKIQGAEHSSKYYKCSQHINQGCPVTKQVQKENDYKDSSLFAVTYIGNHTCSQNMVQVRASQKLYLEDPSSSSSSMMKKQRNSYQ